MRDPRTRLLVVLIALSTAYAALLGCDSKAKGESSDSTSANTEGDVALDSADERDEANQGDSTSDEHDGTPSDSANDGEPAADTSTEDEGTADAPGEDSSGSDALEDIGESGDLASDSADDPETSQDLSDASDTQTETADTDTGLQSCTEAGTTFTEIRFKSILDDIACGETAEYVPYSTGDFEVIACGPGSTVGPSCEGGGTGCDMNSYADTAGIYSYGVQLRVTTAFTSCALSRIEVDGTSVSVAAYQDGELVSLVESFLRNDEVLTDAGSMRSFAVNQYTIPAGVVDVITLSASEGEVIAFRAF